MSGGAAGPDPALGHLQCAQGKDPAAQVGRAPGHPLWHLPHRVLRERQPHGEDARSAACGREGEVWCAGQWNKETTKLGWPMPRRSLGQEVYIQLHRFHKPVAAAVMLLFCSQQHEPAHPVLPP